MTIKVMKTVAGFLLALSFSMAAQAQNASNAWSNPYSSGGVSRQQYNLNQADLIAKREAGYYDNIGKNTFNTTVFTTNTYGTYIDSTTTITGSDNSVGVGADNTGNLNGSINLTSGGSASSYLGVGGAQ